MKKLISLVRHAAMNWYECRSPHMGAALAFYSALSLGPILLLSLACISLVFGHEIAQQHIIREIGGMIGHRSAEAIRAVLVAAANEKDNGFIAAVFGLITLLFSATAVFAELQAALNRLWHVKEDNRTFWQALKERFMSLAMVMGIAFLLLVSLIFSTVFAAIGSYTAGWFSGYAFMLEAVNTGFSFALTTVLFAAMFRILPDADIAWKDVWLGAALTAFLFTIGKSAIGFYIGNSALVSSFGAAGSFVVILVWVYYSAQILFFGASLTYAHAQKARPYKNGSGEGAASPARVNTPMRVSKSSKKFV